MTEQEIADAIAGALVGTVKRYRGTYSWIEKGQKFMVSADDTPQPDFPDTCAKCVEVANLVARETGWVKGVICIGGKPVDLVIEKAALPYDE